MAADRNARLAAEGLVTAMNLFSELKRRNVFRVGAAYAVVAWFLIQAADIMLDNFGAPGWVFKTVAGLLVLGFPLALFLSWAYELTPEGVKKTADVASEESAAPGTGRRIDRVILIALVGALTILVVERVWFAGSGTALPVETEPGVAETGDMVVENLAASATIAVLPFANLSSDDENAYFADGLSEEILNWLAKVSGLKVAGRTSSFYFKGRNEDLRSIGTQLGVAHVLGGIGWIGHARPARG
ncbi:MAG: hypothetical protein RQ847_03280 [Wenzhouxiangellaceae bacterium]|nr:hypothetical protein [Wenzhouxiangellaceae bacterium]